MKLTLSKSLFSNIADNILNAIGNSFAISHEENNAQKRQKQGIRFIGTLALCGVFIYISAADFFYLLATLLCVTVVVYLKDIFILEDDDFPDIIKIWLFLGTIVLGLCLNNVADNSSAISSVTAYTGYASIWFMRVVLTYHSVSIFIECWNDWVHQDEGKSVKKENRKQRKTERC